MMSRPVLSLSVVLAMLGPAQAQAQGARAGEASSEEVARLRAEVRELRQMLIQAMQVEQQHHELLLRLVGSAGAAPAASPPPPGELPATPGAGAAGERARADGRPGAATAVVSGVVTIKGSAAGHPVYVFVENLRGPPARGQSLEIRQKDKQFVPQVSVVPWGTSVYFPNGDAVAHNVFSPTRRRTFDIGLLKAGERGNPVVMRTPGLVEVYCDIHEKMWASVLVVPNSVFVKVAADGKFRLPSVPVGERVIAAWTAGTDPVKQTVMLTGAGAAVNLTLPVPAQKAHNNKAGQPYGSYAE
jgi:plastocyanin